MPSFIGLNVCETLEQSTLDLGNGQFFTLKLQEGVGGSWSTSSFYGITLIATVDSIKWREINSLGLMDSIKYISLAFEDGVSLDFSEPPFQISRNYGLVAAPLTWNLPITSPLLKLAGLSSPLVGKQNTNAEGVFSLSAGAEIHRSLTDTRIQINGYYLEHIDERRSIIDRQFDTANNIITYTVNLEQKIFYSGPNSPSIDTTYAILNNQSWQFNLNNLAWLDSQPGAVVTHPFDPDFYSLVMLGTSDFCGRLAKILGSPFYYESVSDCFSGVLDAPSTLGYYDGIAGGYGSLQTLGGLLEKELVYFGNGEEECSEPFDFTVASREPLNLIDFDIFPNPVSGTLSVNVKNEKAALRSFAIMSIDGKKNALQSSDASFVQLDLAEFPAGMYFLLVEQNGGLIGQQKVVIK